MKLCTYLDTLLCNGVYEEEPAMDGRSTAVGGCTGYDEGPAILDFW